VVNKVMDNKVIENNMGKLQGDGQQKG